MRGFLKQTTFVIVSIHHTEVLAYYRPLWKRSTSRQWLFLRFHIASTFTRVSLLLFVINSDNYNNYIYLKRVDNSDLGIHMADFHSPFLLFV
jgi:hypothetical protein